MKEGKERLSGVIFISNVTKAMEHEWFIDFLDKSRFNIEFVLFNSRDSELHRYILKQGIRCGEYPLKANWMIPFYIIYFWLRLLVRQPDFVHCHLFQASVIGMVSARLAGISKRIYTRHHADVHHIYHPHAVKYDRMVNALSTHIIAVSNNGKHILTEMEQVPAKKVTVITHGIPLALMNRVVPEEQITRMREKYDLLDRYPVIGVISRFVREKGIQYTIPAFEKLLREFPGAVLVLANAKGNYEPEIMKLLSSIPVQNYRLIRFENNIDPLFKCFDVFVHVPIDETCEAFGQVYIEAMSLGVPLVCSISGIAHELVKNDRNALVVNYRNSDDIRQQVSRLLNDDALRERIVRTAGKDVREHSFEKKFEKITKIYLS